MDRRTIVGIDPGTTTAWAVIDLQGNVIQIGSSKEVGLSSLISIAVSSGRPLIVGCDKRKTPGLVEELGRKCGARVVSPREDLKVEFKRGLASGIKTDNSHEMDALASAMFALKEVKPLFDRVNKFIEKENLPKKKDTDAGLTGMALSAEDLFETVLTSRISIKGAAALLSEEETLIEEDGTEDRPQRKTRTIIALLKSSQKEAGLLRAHNQKLDNESKQWQQKARSLEGILKNRKTRQAPDPRVKDATIMQLNRMIILLRSEKDRARNIAARMEKILLDPSEHTIATVADNLGTEEFSRLSKSMDIKTTSIIFVKHPTHVNKNVIETLSAIQPLLLCDERVKNHPLAMVCVKGIPRVMFERIAVFPAERVLAQADKANLLHKVVDDYRKEREIPLRIKT